MKVRDCRCWLLPPGLHSMAEQAGARSVSRDRGTLREARARRGAARRRLRGCVLRPAGMADSRRRPTRSPLAEIDDARRGARGRCRQNRAAAVEGRCASCGRCGSSICERQLAALRARLGMLQGKRLTFDEESRALYDAVAPRHTEAEFAAVLAKLEAQLARRGPADRALRALQGGVHDPARRASTRCSRPPSAPVVIGRVHTSICRRGRELHGRVRHRQIVGRIQLVSGQLPQPDSGQHRPADLHRSRARPRLPRGLSRSSRLQRAAREEPGARSGLGRVHRLPAVLAAIADRRGDGQLRHRGRLPARGAHRLRARRAVSPGGHQDAARSRNTTTSWRSSISCRTPATRQRAAISTGRSMPRPPPTGSSGMR